jgi:hypothetical protein
MKGIIEHYAYYVKEEGWTESGAFRRVNQQIIHAAREAREGYFTYYFDSSYNFEAVSYPHGDSIVFGIFKGYVIEKDGLMRIDGTAEYFFEDEFTDPVDLRDFFFDTSDPMPGVISEKIPDIILAVLRKIYPTSTPEEIGEMIRYITDGGGKVYSINGQWRTRLVAEAKLRENESIYKKPPEK